MKVYVDFEELDVEDRPHYICNKYNLQVKSINSGTRYENVKLVSLADYTKQVRKEVCDEIKEFLENHKYKVFGDYNHQTLQFDENYICELPEINKFLHQIQGDKIE